MPYSEMGQLYITVWTNGKGIRKYTGQDKLKESNSVTYRNKQKLKEDGWYKATAIIIKEEN